MLPIFKTFKVKNYFLLKSRTPQALCSNIIYKFTGLCNTNVTYIGMSSRHLITRVREHLNYKSIQESAVKNHILLCDSCFNIIFGLNNFLIWCKCKLEFHTVIHKAPLIRKSSLNLNCQLYANGTQILLNIFLKSVRFFIFCIK